MRLRDDDVYLTEVDGETVLLDAGTSTYLVLNRTATLLVPTLQSGAEVDELVDLLISTFSVPESTARADCDAFVADLEGHGLLQRPSG